MSRPLRIEFPGAVYHVTSRGDRREPIYRDDEDRIAQLQVIGLAMDRFDAQVLAYSQMGNHFHLVLYTRQGNLSRLMRHVNGVYTQAFNRRHGLVGHLLQGRFKAILVDRDAYLLSLCRYVERNPVAAHLVARAGDWPWSSYGAHVGKVLAPAWLDTEGLLGCVLGRPVQTATDRRSAFRRYDALVNDADPGVSADGSAGDASFWGRALRQQIYLGDEAFVARMQARAETARLAAVDVPAGQRKKMAPTPAQALEASMAQCASREQALRMAYRVHGVTMTALAQAAGLSVSRVSRLIAQAELQP